MPRATRDALRAAGAVLNCPPEPLLRYFEVRGEPTPAGTAVEFEGYLSAVEAAVRFIDQYHVGGN